MADEKDARRKRLRIEMRSRKRVSVTSVVRRYGIVVIGKFLAVRCFPFHSRWLDILEGLYAQNPVFRSQSIPLGVLSDRISVAIADVTRELSICVARLGAVATIFAPSCRGEMLCVNSTNACSHPVTAVAGSGIPTKGCFDCVQPRSISISKWDKESALSASMIPSQIALGWGLSGVSSRG